MLVRVGCFFIWAGIIFQRRLADTEKDFPPSVSCLNHGQTDVETNLSLEDDIVIHHSRYIKIQRNRYRPQHVIPPEPGAEVYCLTLNFNISKLVCCKLSTGAIHTENLQG